MLTFFAPLANAVSISQEMSPKDKLLLVEQIERKLAYLFSLFKRPQVSVVFCRFTVADVILEVGQNAAKFTVNVWEKL